MDTRHLRRLALSLCATFASVPCVFGANLLVTNRADFGPGTLRVVVAAATNGDVITFATNLSGATIVLTNSEIGISNNVSIDGSALASPIQLNGNHYSRVFNVNTGAIVSLNSLVLTNGYTNNDNWGGALANGGTLAMTNCTLVNNTVDSNSVAGAICNTGALLLSGCTFYGNSASYSGAIYNLSNCTAINCTFYSNSAPSGNGGAIDSAYGAKLALVQCTISGNSASGAGGGVDNYLSVVFVTNSIIANNNANGAGDLYNWASSTNVEGGTNVIMSLVDAGISFGTNSSLTSDPLLGAFGFHGGPTMTLLLSGGSPAIDAGSDSLTNIVQKDQRGFRRPSGAHLDIGAVEDQIPTLAITSPLAGETLTNLNWVADGTAFCTNGVTAVYVANTGSPVAEADSSNQWTNWSAPIVLTPLANTFSAYAVGSDGAPSVTSTVVFNFDLTNFTVVTNKQKRATGLLTILINDTGPVRSPNRVTPLKDGALVTLSNRVTLTAGPGKNWIFSNWVFGPSAPYSNSTSRTIKFLMQSNFIAEANFVTNVFIPIAGNYYGLFAPTSGPRAQIDSGAISFTLTSAGAVSGKADLDGVIAPFSGVFDAAGFASIPLRWHGLPATVANLQLDFSNQLATGLISNADFQSPVLAKLNVFSAKNPATNFAGQYTLIIPGTKNAATGPFGTGYGTVKISSTGTVTFSGALADGVSATASSGLGKDGVWPLYLPLYKGKGSFWSWNSFDTNGLVSSNNFPVASLAPSWISGGNSTHGALYAAGFTNSDAVIYGSSYSAADLPTLANMVGDSVIMEGGNLSAMLTNTLADSGSPAAGNVVLSLNKNTGAITGHFLDGSELIKVNGVLLQGQSNVAGFFLGTSQSGLFQLEP